MWNVAQKRMLEKTQFLQQINLGAESEQNFNITRYFNPNEVKELPDKENFLKVFHLKHIFAISLLRTLFPFK